MERGRERQAKDKKEESVGDKSCSNYRKLLQLMVVGSLRTIRGQFCSFQTTTVDRRRALIVERRIYICSNH